jgi:hypothetical protein
MSAGNAAVTAIQPQVGTVTLAEDPVVGTVRDEVAAVCMLTVPGPDPAGVCEAVSRDPGARSVAVRGVVVL